VLIWKLAVLAMPNFISSISGKVGITLSTNWYEPLNDTKEDINASERAMQFSVSLR
jgi:beta-glucosidase/6-phospho-beta-glucosidase/beta-galactosidase